MKEAILNNVVFGGGEQLRYYLCTDVLKPAYSEVLFQLIGGTMIYLTVANVNNIGIVQFIRRMFSRPELRYSNSEKENLNILWRLKILGRLS